MSNLADNKEYTESLLKATATIETAVDNKTIFTFLEGSEEEEAELNSLCTPTTEACTPIQDFLDTDINVFEDLKRQWDILFKEKEKLSIIKTYLELQLKDIEKDLECVHKSIQNIDKHYFIYKQK